MFSNEHIAFCRDLVKMSDNDHNMNSHINTEFDMDGKNLGEIELPSIGTARGFSGKKDDKEVYFTFTNYNSPSIIYSLNPKNNQTQIYWKPDINFDPEKYISKQIFYKFFYTIHRISYRTYIFYIT